MKRCLAAIAALVGCADAPDDVCDGPPDTEFGTGDATFMLLEEGDEMPIFDGPQGGSHLYGAVQACNLEEPLEVTFTVLDDTLGQYIGATEVSGRRLSPTGDCCGEIAGLRSFLSIPSPGVTDDTGYGYGGIAATLDGHALTLTVDVTDATGLQMGMIRHYQAKDAGFETGSSSYGR
jgi:hypothetical protein